MAKKRANGEGSKWYDEAKQLYRAAITTPSGNRLTKSSKSEEVVDDWLNEQRLLIGRNLHVEPSTLTLWNWLWQWVEIYNKPRVRQRTYERNESLIYHVETIGALPLQKITPDHLQNLYNYLKDEGFSSETRKKVHILLNGALKRAVINRYIQFNPAELVDPPKVTRDEIQVFTKDEIDLLLSLAKKHRFYPALLLAVTTGMRLGEVLGVRWRDIDLTNSIIHVRQNLQMTNNKGIIFEPPKTEKGKRKIPLPPQTVAALKEYRKVWSESRIKFPLTKELKEKYPDNEDLVFVSTTHTPVHPKNFTVRFWHRLQEDAEFIINKEPIPDPKSTKEKLSITLENCRMHPNWQQWKFRNFHALRHTYATTLLASGMPIVDVSRVLGHAKVSTTLDIYGHAIPENLSIIADKIAETLLSGK